MLSAVSFQFWPARFQHCIGSTLNEVRSSAISGELILTANNGGIFASILLVVQ